jgi:rRNA maturation RNase YbeY
MKHEARLLSAALNQVWSDHAARKGLSPAPTHLEVNFVDEDTIRALHRDFLQDDSSTDVITFDLGVTPEGWRAATIAICVPVAQQYARRYRASLREELQRLVIHGALHLLGYGDHTPPQKRKMRQQENKILQQMKKY